MSPQQSVLFGSETRKSWNSEKAQSSGEEAEK